MMVWPVAFCNCLSSLGPANESDNPALNDATASVTDRFQRRSHTRLASEHAAALARPYRSKNPRREKHDQPTQTSETDTCWSWPETNKRSQGKVQFKSSYLDSLVSLLEKLNSSCARLPRLSKVVPALDGQRKAIS